MIYINISNSEEYLNHCEEQIKYFQRLVALVDQGCDRLSGHIPNSPTKNIQQ